MLMSIFAGNVKFIGELYKLEILKQGIVFFCIENLLERGLRESDEASLECLCKLLFTAGCLLEQTHPVFSTFAIIYRYTCSAFSMGRVAGITNSLAQAEPTQRVPIRNVARPHLHRPFLRPPARRGTHVRPTRAQTKVYCCVRIER